MKKKVSHEEFIEICDSVRNLGLGLSEIAKRAGMRKIEVQIRLFKLRQTGVKIPPIKRRPY